MLGDLMKYAVLSLTRPTVLTGEPVHQRCSQLVQGEGLEVVDLGSGPFLQPGALIAKQHPGIRVTCVDPRYERESIITPLKNLPNLSISSSLPDKKFDVGTAIRVFCSKDFLEAPDSEERVGSLSRKFARSIKGQAILAFTEYPKAWPAHRLMQSSMRAVERSFVKEGFKRVQEELVPRHQGSYLPKECLHDILRVYSKR